MRTKAPDSLMAEEVIEIERMVRTYYGNGRIDFADVVWLFNNL